MYVTINNLKHEVAIVSIFIFVLFLSLSFIISDIIPINKFSAMGPSPLPPAEVYRPRDNFRDYYEEQKLILTPPLNQVVEACPGGCIYYNGCVNEGQCIIEGYICERGRFIESCGNRKCEYECETPESCPEDCDFKISIYGHNIDNENYYIGWTSDYYKYPDRPSRTVKQDLYLYEIYKNEFEITFKNGDREIKSSIVSEDRLTELTNMILKIDSANCMIDIRRLFKDEGKIIKYYKNTGILVLETPWYLVDDISKNPCVRNVYPDNLVMLELDTSTQTTKTKDVWNMLSFYEHCYDVTIGIGTYEECIILFPYISNVKGTGVEIAFVDSGIDTTHVDFEEKITKQINVREGVADTSDVSDLYGHGTHCASIALGSGAGSNKYTGNAPKTNIWAIKAMDSGGYAMHSYIIRGINYAADPNEDGDCSDHVDILSLSLGLYVGSDGTTPDSLAVQHAIACGVLVVKSAGNQGTYGHGTITSPGDLEDVITVGAIDKYDNIYSKSSIGPVDNRILKPDLVAPGVSIIAARAHGSGYWTDYAGIREVYDEIYTNSTGTSMAAPQVAGAAALLLSENRDLTNTQIKSKLMLSATPLGNSVFKEGAGKLNTLKALHCPIATYPQSAFFNSPTIGSSKTFQIHNLERDVLEVRVISTPIYNELGSVIDTKAQVTPEVFYLDRGEIKEFELTFTNMTNTNWQYGRIQIIIRPYGKSTTTTYNIPFGIKK